MGTWTPDPAPWHCHACGEGDPPNRVGPLLDPQRKSGHQNTPVPCRIRALAWSRASPVPQARAVPGVTGCWGGTRITDEGAVGLPCCSSLHLISADPLALLAPKHHQQAGRLEDGLPCLL